MLESHQFTERLLCEYPAACVAAFSLASLLVRHCRSIAADGNETMETFFGAVARTNVVLQRTRLWSVVARTMSRLGGHNFDFT
jgi:hypothetical protein